MTSCRILKEQHLLEHEREGAAEEDKPDLERLVVTACVLISHHRRRWDPGDVLFSLKQQLEDQGIRDTKVSILEILTGGAAHIGPPRRSSSSVSDQELLSPPLLLGRVEVTGRHLKSGWLEEMPD